MPLSKVFSPQSRKYANPLVLSLTQHLVLHHKASGYTNSDTAERLSICEKTVKNHLAISYKTLGVNSGIEAVVKLIKLGLLKLEDI